MPRYFFNTADGGCDIDPRGEELPDAAAARKEAIRYLGSILHDEPNHLQNGEMMIEVQDETRATLYRLFAREERLDQSR